MVEAAQFLLRYAAVVSQTERGIEAAVDDKWINRNPGPPDPLELCALATGIKILGMRRGRLSKEKDK